MSRSATDYRSGPGDQRYPRETERPAEMQKLLEEFRTLYHERLQRIDQSGDGSEESLQSKVGVLQEFVRDLSEQNEVLIRALDERGPPADGRGTSPHRELERCPSSALRPMPTDLAGTPVTFLRTRAGELPAHDALLKQLRDVSLSRQEAQAKVEEREALVQDLQHTITELHQEITRKEKDQLSQLLQIQHLQSSLETLTEQRGPDLQESSPGPGPPPERSGDVLKSELAHRDATIQKLRRDVLLSHQARDSQTAQLDVLERRICQLQTELQERQQELQRGRGRTSQLQRDLQTSARQAEELTSQLTQARGRLVQVEGENEALVASRRAQGAELERLTAEVCALQKAGEDRAAAESALAERRCVELEGQLAVSQAQLAESEERALEARRREEEQSQMMQAELSTLTAQHSSVIQQAQDRCAELQVSLDALRGREAAWEGERAALLAQLSRVREELHSATVGGEAERHREERIVELQREVCRLKEQQEIESRETNIKLSGKEDAMKSLREEQQILKEKEVQAGRDWAEETHRHERDLQAWKERCRAASEALRLREAELEEVQRGRDTALRSLSGQEERSAGLLAHNQELLLRLEEMEAELCQHQDAAEGLRARLEAEEGDASTLRRQLLASQDALQQLSSELGSLRRERADLVSRGEETEERMSDVRGDLLQLQQHYTTCYTQLVQEEKLVSRLQGELREAGEERDRLASRVKENQGLGDEMSLLLEKHRAAQLEVASRDEVVLRLTAELRTAQQQLQAAQEEQERAQQQDLLALQEQVSSLQARLSRTEETLEAEKLCSSKLQEEKDMLIAELDSQRGALCEQQGEVQRWQAEARAQQEGREEEAGALRVQLQEAQGRLLQSEASAQRLRSELEQARALGQQAEEEAAERDLRLRSQEAELVRLKAVLREAESGAADLEARLKPLNQSLELYKTKYQTCLGKLAQQESALQAQQEELREAGVQAAEREEQALRLRAQAAALQGALKAREAQLESGDEALGTLGQRLREAQAQLEDGRRHGRECELVICSLRENAAHLRTQVEEQQESAVKVQADFSTYRANHVHSDADYNSQLSHVQELQQALSRAREQGSQCAQQLTACQAEVQQLREEVSTITQLRDSSLAEVLRLQAEAGCEAQRRQHELGQLEQTAGRLERELEEARSLAGHREKELQKRDALLRRSQSDLLEAREALRGRAMELERQGAAGRSLEAELLRVRREGQQREAEGAGLRSQLLQLREELREAQGRCRDTAQELARQEERALLVEGGQQRAQEQLAERVSEVVRAEQAQRKLEAELRSLREALRSAQQERHRARAQLESLQKEVAESKQAQLSAQQQTQLHQQGELQLEAELAKNKETLASLQQQLQEHADASQALQAELAEHQARQTERQNELHTSKERETALETERDQLHARLDSANSQLRKQESTIGSLQGCLAEQQSATQRLQEEQAACQAQLQECRVELGSRVAQGDTHKKELSHLQKTVPKLKRALDEAQASGRQGARDRAAAEQRVKELRLELASTQASHKESMELLAERTREAAAQRSELSRLQQRSAQLVEELGRQEDRSRLLATELSRLRSTCSHSQDEARACQGRLAELQAQLSKAERWGQEQLSSLEAREEEMKLIKVEMNSLRENYHAKVAQVEALQSQLESLKQKYSTATNKVDVLRRSLGEARSDRGRLRAESELVVSNVNQWVKEQKQANDTLGRKTREQNRKILHLTTERDHLQESVDTLHRESRRLKAELDDRRLEVERCRISQVSRGEQVSAQARLLSPQVHTQVHTGSALAVRGASTGPEERLTTQIHPH